MSVEDSAERAAALRALLAQLPETLRQSKPQVVVAVGPQDAQLRALDGLPAAESAAVLTRAVRASASRFFVAPDGLQRTGDVLPGRSGVWVASVDGSVLDDVTEACRASSLRLGAVVPAAAVMSCIWSEGPFAWTDGELAWTGRSEQGRLLELRRLPSVHPEVQPSIGALPKAIEAFGEQGKELLTAYAAALSPLPAPFDCVDHRVRQRNRRVYPAAAACVLAGMICAFGPLVVTRAEAARARSELTVLSPRLARADSLAVRQRERRATDLALSDFLGADRPALGTLIELTNALSESSSLASLRIDSTGGTMSVLTSETALLLDELRRAPRIDSTRILGALVPEQLDGERYERVTIRFGWRRPVAPGTMRTVEAR